MQPGTADSVPPTCVIRDWIVFDNGFHKGQAYAPERCHRIVENYNRLSAGSNPAIRPNLKLGHDKQQRLARSLGLPSQGSRFIKCELAPDFGPGAIRISIAGVPTWLGGMINAGRYNAGSIEIDQQMKDPADPGKVIQGPIMTGVALLGEEQPAVKGLPPPRAVFEDGTPVPPNHDPLPVEAAVLAPNEESSFSTSTCFSEAIMTPEQMKAELLTQGIPEVVLAKLDDAGITELYNSMMGNGGTGNDQFKAAMSKKFAAPPGVPAPPATPTAPDPKAAMGAKFAEFSKTFSDDEKKDPEKMAAKFAAFAMDNAGQQPDMMAQMKSCMAEAIEPMKKEFTQRLGALEAQTTQKQAEEAKGATMAAVAMSEKVVDDAIFVGKVMKADRETFVNEGVKIMTEMTFSDAATKKAAVDAWKAKFANRPITPAFKEVVDDRRLAGNGHLTPLQQSILNSENMKRNGSIARNKILELNPSNN